MSKYIKYNILIFAILTLPACSFFSIGKKNYSCSGIPEGVKCMSARQVYEATNNGQNLQSQSVQESEKKDRKQENTRPVVDVVIDNYVAPNLPDRPIPIRTPAIVMRIWVAPWEDKQGDLITPGYIYTEIEPRKWVIGKKNSSSNSSITPLK